MTCVTTQTVALKYFLQHWYDLCYNTNSCFEMFLATIVWLVLQHKHLVWNVSCNIGMTCVTTQTVGSELFLTTLVWLVLQHKQLLWTVSCNIDMTCVTTQTVALNCFLQHWYDLCYNTNSCFVMFLATLVWLVLQHKQLHKSYQYCKKQFRAAVCVVTQVIPMLQETIQSNCLCCNTSHTNVARNSSKQLIVL